MFSGVLIVIVHYMCSSHLQYYFDYQPGEIFACLADIGWITGHSYVVYGPLCNGATTLLFDSTAIHPNPCELITTLIQTQEIIIYVLPVTIMSYCI